LKEQIGTGGIEKSQFYILQALTELRQIASSPEARTEGKVISAKREALMENILDAVANGHKSLIFVSFLNAIETISEDLEKNGIDFVSMTGATRDRQKLVERFQGDKNCKVFLMTLKTGGVGLNLTAADMVYIYDPWWNLAAENQAIDRTHRMGQKKTVFSYKLITKGTIEEKILQLQEQKKELFENLIGSDSASIKSLNQEDIDFILGYLRNILLKRKDLKLIITSATIDTAKFAQAFDDAPVIEVSGRMYPVEVRYSPLDPVKEEKGETTTVDEVPYCQACVAPISAPAKPLEPPVFESPH
jgi:superfamily II DNA or RNA helicase